MARIPYRVAAITLATAGALVLSAAGPAAAETESLNPQQHFAREVYQELVQTNTTASVGDTYKAAQAVAGRLKTAGFADEDVHVFETAPKRGTGKHKATSSTCARTARTSA